MSDREKIEKAVDLIRKADTRDDHVNPNEIYEGMREHSLFELAEEFSQFVNLIADIREVLEEDDLEIKESDILEVTLLSVEEARKLPKEMRKAEHSWWLRSPGRIVFKAAFVHGDLGNVIVNGPNVASEFGVRPALKFKSSLFKNGDSFTYRGYDWDMITDDTALCKTIVGKCAFREDWKADNANDYESSDIKKWLNDWWQKVRSRNDTN